LVNKLVC